MLVFINKQNDEELNAISVKGIYTNEVQETAELIAYEHGLQLDDITLKLKEVSDKDVN